MFVQFAFVIWLETDQFKFYRFGLATTIDMPPFSAQCSVCDTIRYDPQEVDVCQQCSTFYCPGSCGGLGMCQDCENQRQFVFPDRDSVVKDEQDSVML